MKVRVYIIAKRYGWEPRKLAELCRAAGMTVANQLTVLDEEQQRQVEELIRRHGGEPPEMLKT
jgi:hypothetical protein